MTVNLVSGKAQKEEKKFEKKVDKLAHIAKFEAVLGDATQWEYRGECFDLKKPVGKCVCGHPIRYEFPIYHKVTGQVLTIGSVCIDSTVAFLMAHGNIGAAEKLAAAYEEHKKRIAELKKQAKEQEQNEQIKALLANDITPWAEWCKVAVQAVAKKWVPTYWYSGDYRWVYNPPAASTPGRTLAGLRKRLATLKKEAEYLRGMYPELVPALPGTAAAQEEENTVDLLLQRLRKLYRALTPAERQKVGQFLCSLAEYLKKNGKLTEKQIAAIERMEEQRNLRQAK